VDLPLLTTLAVAQDSLTLDALLALSGTKAKPEVMRHARRVLDRAAVFQSAANLKGNDGGRSLELNHGYPAEVDAKQGGQAWPPLFFICHNRLTRREPSPADSRIHRLS